jgi:hypothetical protein
MGPAVSVGIANKAMILFENPFDRRVLSRTFLFAFADRDYFSHVGVSPVFPSSPGDQNSNVNLSSIFP